MFTKSCDERVTMVSSFLTQSPWVGMMMLPFCSPSNCKAQGGKSPGHRASKYLNPDSNPAASSKTLCSSLHTTLPLNVNKPDTSPCLHLLFLFRFSGVDRLLIAFLYLLRWWCFSCRSGSALCLLQRVSLSVTLRGDVFANVPFFSL